MTITILTKARVTCAVRGCGASADFDAELTVDHEGFNFLASDGGYGHCDNTIRLAGVELPEGWMEYWRCGHERCHSVLGFSVYGSPHLCPEHAAVHREEVAKDVAKKKMKLRDPEELDRPGKSKAGHPGEHAAERGRREP